MLEDAYPISEALHSSSRLGYKADMALYRMAWLPVKYEQRASTIRARFVP